MEDCFLVTCGKIQKTGLFAETVTYRTTHVRSAIVTFIKIDVKLGCVQYFGVQCRNLSEISQLKVLQDTCRKEI